MEPVTSTSAATNYRDRSELIAQVSALLKVAKHDVPDGLRSTDLDTEGWEQLHRLVGRLIRHLYFEHLDRKRLETELLDVVHSYTYPDGPPTPKRVSTATEFLDGLAREPMRQTFYLGVEHLGLPHGTSVNGIRFIRLAEDPVIAHSFCHLLDRAPTMVCEVQSTGGTKDLILERARKSAERALALVRQQMLFGFAAKIYLDQVVFGLDGTYSVTDESGMTVAGWSNVTHPIPMDLKHDNVPEWFTKLDEISTRMQSLPTQLRERVELSVDWLDVAALSDRWRIIIPAIFSAMEAILVPEKASLKAALVTVRSVAVQAAVENPFSEPVDTMLGYDLRSDLVHGTPTNDVLEAEAFDFAERRRLWAFKVLCDYLELALQIHAETVKNMVTHLDDGLCHGVCTWLGERGASRIVAEYEDALASNTPKSPTV